MIKYDQLGVHISMLKEVLRFLQELETEIGKEMEIVVVGQVIDSLNQSIERLVELRGEVE